MTRGNQRELAREKNLKKQQKNKKTQGTKTDNLTQKKEKDADIMRQKQLAAEAKRKEGEEAGGASNSKK